MARRKPTPKTPPPPAGENAPEAAPAARQTSRWRILLIGLVIGALWGVAYALFMFAIGRQDAGDIGTWIYRIATPALIGMVVATVFGPVRGARRDGSLAPRRSLLRRRG